jgi:broad-specificity NMP kinase
MAEGGRVVEHHSPEMFPERWFDLVLVLRCETEQLFDRLSRRGYGKRKLDENMSAEIVGVVEEEAREAYAREVVHAVPSNSPADVDTAVDQVLLWARNWLADHPDGVDPAAPIVHDHEDHDGGDDDDHDGGGDDAEDGEEEEEEEEDGEEE